MKAKIFIGSKIGKFLKLKTGFDKAWEKTLFHFFSWWFCVRQKNESVFCAVECGGLFLQIYFLKRWH